MFPFWHAQDAVRFAVDLQRSLRGWQSRPNVIYEAGMAMGIDETRTILATLGSDVSLFSDVSGVHIVQLDNTPEKRSFLRSKLHGVGCAVDMSATEYLVISRAGDFVKCIEFAGEGEPVDTFTGSASDKKKPASGRRKPGQAQSAQRILSIDQEHIGPRTSSGDPAGRRTDFRVRPRITNKTVRNVTLVDVHAFVRSHDGRILDVPFSESREQAIPPRDGTVLVTAVTPIMLAREDQVPKLGLVVVRIAQRTEPIRKVFDDEIAAQSERTG